MIRHATFRLTLATLLLLVASTLAVAGSPKGPPARKPTPPPTGRKTLPPQVRGTSVGQHTKSPSATRTESVNNNAVAFHKRIDKSMPIKNPMAGKPVSPSPNNLGDTGTHEVGHAVSPRGKTQTPPKSWNWFSPGEYRVKSNAVPNPPSTLPGKPVRPSASGIIAILIGL